MTRSETTRAPRLTDRRDECARLEQLIAGARAGISGALVVRGAAGIGKSALLGHLLVTAAGCRIVRVDSVESEMELAYSGLHQLCTPLMEQLPRLPEPQRAALETAFGLRAGNPADKFLVGLAVLSLMSDAAEVQPLVCLLDDAQWLDRVSAQVLGFVARRLGAESVVVVFAVRDGTDLRELAGLPELRVPPLADVDARELLDSALPGRVDGAVRDRIVAEAHGNPLALLELPKSWSTAALAGGYGLPDAGTLPERVEESFRRRLAVLPPASRELLLIVAAEPVGDPELVWSAATLLGIQADAAGPATAAGLLEGGLRFRHGMVRSVVYRDASADHRRRVHAALASCTDPERDPDRRAWHLAAAASEPDPGVADALESSAGRAQARGGVAAAAAFLRRSATLTLDPAQRAERILAAAQASFQAGAFEEALALLDEAERAPMNAVRRASTDLLRAHIAFAAGFGSDAPPLLEHAATQMFALDPVQGRQTYLIAWVAAVFAGTHARPGELERICATILDLPPVSEPGALELLMEGVSLLILRGTAAAAPTLQRAGRLLPELDVEDVVRWGWSATAATTATWDPDGTLRIAEKQNAIFRQVGALGQLPIVLAALGNSAVWAGDLPGAASIAAEATSVAAAIGSQFPPTVALRLLGARGVERDAVAAIAETMAAAGRGGQGLASTNADWAAAVLYNGLARYEHARAAARQATAATHEPFVSVSALPELVEAAVRVGHADEALDALERLAETTAPCATDTAAGIEARCRALVDQGAAAEDLYRESIDRLGRTPLRPELARSQLVYGEWLRREGRRSAARDVLRPAYELFDAMGMIAFAERTRRELLATGERVRKRSGDGDLLLTPQEVQIARLARDGHSNQEIGAHLFLSPRTVEWHLRKVFAKLGVASRRDLPDALARPR